MLADVGDLLRREADVDRHQERAQQGNREVGLEHGRHVGDDVGDPVTLPDPRRLQGGRAALDAIGELRVGVAAAPVDDGFLVFVDPVVALHEVERA